MRASPRKQALSIFRSVNALLILGVFRHASLKFDRNPN
jgi:hypothetical protein